MGRISIFVGFAALALACAGFIACQPSDTSTPTLAGPDAAVDVDAGASDSAPDKRIYDASVDHAALGDACAWQAVPPYCPEGYQCANFRRLDPSLTEPRCAPTPACSVVTCDTGGECTAGAIYPLEVTCH